MHPEFVAISRIHRFAISGGVFRGSYAVYGAIDQFIPVDVNVPGCPPRPQAIIDGIIEAVKIWETKL